MVLRTAHSPVRVQCECVALGRRCMFRQINACCRFARQMPSVRGELVQNFRRRRRILNDGQRTRRILWRHGFCRGPASAPGQSLSTCVGRGSSAVSVRWRARRHAMPCRAVSCHAVSCRYCMPCHAGTACQQMWPSSYRLSGLDEGGLMSDLTQKQAQQDRKGT